MKKLMCMFLALLMAFTCMACAGGGGVSTTAPPGETTAPTTEATAAPTTVPTVPTTEATADTTEATVPATTEGETQPQETKPAETEPAETKPAETKPAETKPAETEPAETKPVETEPAETAPPATEGNSGNGSDAVDPATCKHKSLKVVESREPTPEQEGYTLLRCGDCGYEIRQTKEYSPPAETEPEETTPPELSRVADPAEVASYLLQYINQFRANQGSTQLTWLPGMSNVAQYRSGQLVYNFAHDIGAFKEAAAYYKYGEWVEMSDPSQSYYDTQTNEAIGKGEGSGVATMSAEELGRKMAEAYLSSSDHWRYLGSSEYSYAGVGVTYANGVWYDCVLVGRVNYG